MSAVDGFCVICKEANEPLVTVKDRGFDSLLKYSKERKDEVTTRYLQEKKNKDFCTSVQVHEKCRKWYNNKRRVSTLQNEK